MICSHLTNFKAALSFVSIWHLAVTSKARDQRSHHSPRKLSVSRSSACLCWRLDLDLWVLTMVSTVLPYHKIGRWCDHPFSRYDTFVLGLCLAQWPCLFGLKTVTGYACYKLCTIFELAFISFSRYSPDGRQTATSKLILWPWPALLILSLTSFHMLHTSSSFYLLHVEVVAHF